MRAKSFQLLISFILLSYCSQKNSTDKNITKKKYLYWTSASWCFHGLTSTPPAQLLGANLVLRQAINPSGPVEIVWDYSVEPHSENEVPASLSFDTDNKLLLVGVEAPSRRVDYFSVESKSRIRFLQHSSLNSAIRAIFLTPDKNILISRTTAIELFAEAGTRLTIGANPWVSNPGGTCSNTNTQVLRVYMTPEKHIFYLHPNTTAANNKLAVVRGSGYSAVADCLGGFTYPATFLPSAAAWLDSKILVSVVGSNPAANSRLDTVDVTFDSNTNAYTFQAPTTVYQNPTILQSPTSLAFDSETNTIYVATFNDGRIKKFKYDPTNSTNPVTYEEPLLPRSYLTKCVSDMILVEH